MYEFAVRPSRILYNYISLFLFQLTKDFQFHVVPILNPDGYEYTRSKDRRDSQIKKYYEESNKIPAKWKQLF